MKLRRSRASRRSGTFAILCSAALLFGVPALTGCGAAAPLEAKLPGAETAIVPAEVGDEAFAQRTLEILHDGSKSPERLELLAGVVKRQLAHAAQRFEAGQTQRGVDSVLGALYLVRRGEGRREMVDEVGEHALAGAIEYVSQRGDEGAARALMLMRRAALPEGSPEQKEIDGHLAALERWVRDTETGSEIEIFGDRERAAVARSLVDPSDEALVNAAAVLSAFIDKAIEYNIRFRQTGKRPTRAEAVEASRALESGATTLVAVHLRHGDAVGALRAVEETAARRIIDPEFYGRLRAAAEDDTSHAWKELLAHLAIEATANAGGEIGVDLQVLRAALFGTALEAHRRDPSDFGPARALSRILVGLGLSEVAPLVITGAMGEHPSPEVVSSALGLVMSAVREDASSNDVPAARRTMRAATQILKFADHEEMKGRIQPTASQLRFLMASAELRTGELGHARPLLELAVAEDPSAAGYTMLAVVERQASNHDAALAHVAKAVAPPYPKTSLLDVADANLLAFEIHRDVGQNDRAEKALGRALSSVLAARERRIPLSAKARAERLLGRILDSYGEAQGASRAIDRALRIAANDRPTLAATMLDVVGQALVQGDVEIARAALRQALDAGVDEQDLGYGGLWLMLLEKQQREPPDGTALRALESVRDRSSWVYHLASWARGDIGDAELSELAQNPSQRVEAEFYAAMAKKIAGDPSATEGLKSVATSGVIDLVEVHIARELTAPRFDAKLPTGIRVP